MGVDATDFEVSNPDVSDLPSEVLVPVCRVRSYASDILLKDLADEDLKHRDHVAIRWMLDLEKPDRSRVFQSGWQNGRELFDEWINVGPTITETQDSGSTFQTARLRNWNDSVREAKRRLIPNRSRPDLHRLIRNLNLDKG